MKKEKLRKKEKRKKENCKYISKKERKITM